MQAEALIQSGQICLNLAESGLISADILPKSVDSQPDGKGHIPQTLACRRDVRDGRQVGVRRVLGACKNRDQGWIELYRHGKRAVRERAKQAGELPLGMCILQLIHRLWGHAVRHPDSPLGTSLLWRVPRWWRTVRMLANLPGTDVAEREPHSKNKWRRTADAIFEIGRATVCLGRLQLYRWRVTGCPHFALAATCPRRRLSA